MPQTFRILYSYTSLVGASSLFSLDEFVSSVLVFMFFAGLTFLLPIVMFLLTYLSVISPAFWRAHWRYALLTFLIVSAIITPDGSGVSMLILSAPLLGLYGVGCTVTHFKDVRSSYIIT